MILDAGEKNGDQIITAMLATRKAPYRTINIHYLVTLPAVAGTYVYVIATIRQPHIVKGLYPASDITNPVFCFVDILLSCDTQTDAQAVYRDLTLSGTLWPNGVSSAASYPRPITYNRLVTSWHTVYKLAALSTLANPTKADINLTIALL